MEKLAKAKALLNKPMSLEELRKLDQLERQAKGEEKLYIASLWEAALTLVEPAALHQVQAEGLC